MHQTPLWTSLVHPPSCKVLQQIPENTICRKPSIRIDFLNFRLFPQTDAVFFLIHCYVYQYRRLFPRKQENKSKFWHFPLFVQEPPGSTTIFLGTLDITFSNFLCYNEPDRRKCFCLFLFCPSFCQFHQTSFCPPHVCLLYINQFSSASC